MPMLPFKSAQFAHGSEFYDLSDQYDNQVTGFTGNYYYYGYVNNAGWWVIAQYQPTTGTWRYCNGRTSYSAAWSGKALLSYVYLYQLSGTTP